MPVVSLGFLSANNRRGSHYDDFLNLIPQEASVEITPLSLWKDSLYDLKGKTEEHIHLVTGLQSQNKWDGIALMGAPMQVQNPDHIQKLRAVIEIPITTALEAGTAALKAFGAKNILLLTPFDDGLNSLLQDFLEDQALEVSVPINNRTDTRKADVDSTERKTTEEVFSLAINAYQEYPDVEAIYFQGAPLNPLHAIEDIESTLGIPVIASNPAMFWHISSLLSYRFPGSKGGRLLEEWPSLSR